MVYLAVEVVAHGVYLEACAMLRARPRARRVPAHDGLPSRFRNEKVGLVVGPIVVIRVDVACAAVEALLEILDANLSSGEKEKAGYENNRLSAKHLCSRKSRQPVRERPCILGGRGARRRRA